MTYRHLVPEVACQKYEPRVFGFKVRTFLYECDPKCNYPPLQIRQQKERLDTV